MAQLSVVALNGQVAVLPSRGFLAASGYQFVCTNPTVGTAIAYANKTSWSATANGLFSISNSNPTGGANLYFDRLRLIQTATAPTGTNIRWEVYLQTTIAVISSAAAAITPVNANPLATTSTKATVTFFNAGAGTVPAVTGVRTLVDEGSMAVGVSVANDTNNWDFYSDGMAAGKMGVTAARSTDPADLWTQGGPIIVPPGCTAFMNLWGPATNVPSYEFRFTYFEF